MINNPPNFTWRRKHLFQITNKTTTTATTKLFERHNIETTWGCHISWTWIWTYILNLNYIYPNYVNIINMFHFSITLNSYTICLLFNLYPRKSQHAGGNCVFQRCKDLSRCGPVIVPIILVLWDFNEKHFTYAGFDKFSIWILFYQLCWSYVFLFVVWDLLGKELIFPHVFGDNESTKQWHQWSDRGEASIWMKNLLIDIMRATCAIND